MDTGWPAGCTASRGPYAEASHDGAPPPRQPPHHPRPPLRTPPLHHRLRHPRPSQPAQTRAAVLCRCHRHHRRRHHHRHRCLTLHLRRGQVQEPGCTAATAAHPGVKTARPGAVAHAASTLWWSHKYGLGRRSRARTEPERRRGQDRRCAGQLEGGLCCRGAPEGGAFLGVLGRLGAAGCHRAHTRRTSLPMQRQRSPAVEASLLRDTSAWCGPQLRGPLAPDRATGARHAADCASQPASLDRHLDES